MAYQKWGIRQYEKQKGLKGVASVRVTATTVRVAFKDNPEEIYEINLDKAQGVVKSGTWWVSLSAQGDRLYGINPVSGAFPLRFKEISHTQGQPPTPQSYTSHWKDPNGKDMETKYDAFVVLFEITDGPCAGMIVPKFLRYYFASSMDGYVVFDKPKSPHTKVLSDTLDVCGAFDKGQMKYSENILPALDARMKASSHSLMGIMKDGNLDSLTQTQEFHEEEEEPVGHKFDKMIDEGADVPDKDVPEEPVKESAPELDNLSKEEKDYLQAHPEIDVKTFLILRSSALPASKPAPKSKKLTKAQEQKIINELSPE